jgi:hypothetical protein
MASVYQLSDTHIADIVLAQVNFTIPLQVLPIADTVSAWIVN